MNLLQAISLGAELYRKCSKINGPIKEKLRQIIMGAIEHKAIPLGYHPEPENRGCPSYWWLTFGDLSPHIQEGYIAEHTPPGVRTTRISTNGL